MNEIPSSQEMRQISIQNIKENKWDEHVEKALTFFIDKIQTAAKEGKTYTSIDYTHREVVGIGMDYEGIVYSSSFNDSTIELVISILREKGYCCNKKFSQNKSMGEYKEKYELIVNW